MRNEGGEEMICQHRWEHKGPCPFPECEVCLEANLKCTYENPWCGRQLRMTLIRIFFAIVAAVILFLIRPGSS